MNSLNELRIITLIFFGAVGTLTAQENYSDSSKRNPVVTYEMNILAFGGGISNSKISGEVSPDTRYLNKTLNRNGINIQFLEFRSFFKDRIGLTTGFSFYQSGTGSSKIMKDFPRVFTDNNVTFNAPNNAGFAPLRMDFTCATLDAGLIGKFKLRKVSILPFVSYLIPLIRKNSNYLNANFINNSNGETFKRRYEFTNRLQNAFKAGIDVRYGKKHVYVGGRISYTFYKVAGQASYKDTDSGNNVVSEQKSQFGQNFNIVTFQAIVGAVF